MSNKKWENFKKKHAEKRRKKDEKLPDAVDYLTVQRLTADVEGKCQKYGRIGPLAIVPFEYDTLTFDNIKKACKSYFDVASYMECDVLAGERGPSYSSIDQIKNLKLLHVRFYFDSKVPELSDGDDKASCSFSSDSTFRSNTKRPKIEKVSVVDMTSSRKSLPAISPKKVVQPSTFPKSVSLSTLLQLGKVIHPKCSNEIIELYLEEFCIEKKEWLLPFSVKVSVNGSPFASGGFRNAYEAQAISGLEGKYVLKRYIPDQVNAIEEMFGSLDIHTRKSVQMHSLAKYYASLMKKESSAHEEFGESFRYSKVYLARSEGQLVTLEPYLQGKFVKYINNDGEIIVSGNEVASKAEAFVHFTYVKSQKAVMVLDIQGTGYSLYDPEVASTQLQDEETKSLLFCCGNLSTNAIDFFLSSHKCGKYCAFLGIDSL